MCGICGFTFEDKTLLKNMCRLIAHRGNDARGFYYDKNISLGHQRLSIIDLEGGKQPIYNENKDICVVYNGEIYNFAELKEELQNLGHKFYTNTDTEVIVHAYEEWGTDCVRKFNGMYAFALWNSKDKELFLARDRLGIKPLYYTIINGSLAFASESKALMILPGFDKTLNKNAIDMYLTFRAVLGQECMFSSVKKLLPGHTLLWKSKKTRIEKYWGVEEKFLEPTEKEIIQNLRSLLEDSVKRHMIADVPVGAFLSGGLDSSAVVALMSKYGTVKTFSVGFGGEFDELKYAKTVSEKFRTDHHEIYVKEDALSLLPKIVWHFDEPVADPAAVPTYVLSRETRKKCKVVLTGEGGDEIFAGYEQYKFMTLKERFKGASKAAGSVIGAVPPSLLSYAFPYASRLGMKGIRRARGFLREDGFEKAYMEITSVFNEDDLNAICGSSGYSLEFLKSAMSRYKHPLNKMQLFELENILPDNLLMKVDRMTMAHSLEARVPLLDHRIAEYSFSLHPSIRFRNSEPKYLFKKSVKDILPKEILNRRKQRFFVPIDEWLQKREAKNYIENFYLSGDTHAGLKVNPKYIHNIFQNYDNSKLFYARQLWSLLNMAMWYETFVDKDAGNAL
ncbi:Glutamine--fructose-6-phosphate aminotransferase [isomerizing] [uncultured archaeon]|nr:Glutamine--fructose-6-phosphate aminotransferase [isomerizing] [uncultured archaeon]